MDKTTQIERPLVLIVDDDAATQFLMPSVLEQNGFSVEMVPNGS